MSIDTVLARLDGPRKTTKGWSARCPAHDDRSPSLSIAVGDDGRVLLRCHAGCTTDAIVGAMGVTMADLFDDDAKPTAKKKPVTIYTTVEAAVEALERRFGVRHAGLWAWPDATGHVVGYSIRFEPPGKRKEFRPLRLEGAGWVEGWMTSPRPLLRIADLAAADRVTVHEGERKVDTANALGFVATTSASGSQAGHLTDWSPLAGKEVWIFPDHDTSGEKYASVVAGCLAKLDPPARVRMVRLPGLPEGGDIVDWVAAHGDSAEPASMAAEIEAIAAAQAVPVQTGFKRRSFREFMATEFSRDYLVDGVLAANSPAIIAGAQKTMKTGIALDLCISLATGTPFLGRFAVTRTARCGIMTGEIAEADIHDAGRRIAQAKGVNYDFDYPRISTDLPQMADDVSMDMLRQFIVEDRLEVLVIDPVYLAMDIGESASNIFSVGKMLHKLSKIAQETGCMPVLAHHTKGGGREHERPELEHIAWAGFKEWARQWILLARREKFDPESPGEHRLWMNYGGSAGHHGCHALDITEGRRTDPGGRRWDVELRSATEAIEISQEMKSAAKEHATAFAKHRQRMQERQRAIEAIRKFPGETANVLRGEASMSGGTFAAVVAELEQAGTVQITTVIKNGKKYQAYQMVNRTDPDSTGLSVWSG